MAKTLKEVLQENNIELQESSSGRLVARCPLHDGDNEPSFTVYPTDTYWCFGCDRWGDAVKFLVDYKGISAKEALEYVGLDYKQPKAEKAKVIKVRNTQNTWRFLWDCAEQYHKFLLSNPGAINYLLNRHITLETIKKYKIGYTDGRVLNLMFAWERQMAEEIGLMTKAGYETLSHRIVFPNLLEEGYADFMIGRTVINDKVKYLGARMPKPLQGFYEVRSSPVIFIVEGQFDWLTLRQWGYPAVVMSGSHITRALQLTLREKQVIIVPDYDPEDQGMKAAQKLKNQIGDSAHILDWAVYNDKPVTKLDINTYADYPEAERSFADIVRLRLPWLNTYLSQKTLTKWFPSLAITIPLLSTLKLQV